MNNAARPLDLSAKIYIAGHRGLVGSAVVRAFEAAGFEHLILRTHRELDLTDQRAVIDFFAENRPDYVILAAAKVGGIHANNTYPADFIYQNLMMEANVIHAAFHHQVKRLLFLGSSCIYPQKAAQPMAENSLLSGVLEPTNEPYAVAKIAGIKLCESFNRQHDTDFRSLMPTNLYGINDNFHPQNSHVIPALMAKFHRAKTARERTVEIWGTGKVRREFLFVDDLADAALFVLSLSREIYRQNTEPMCSHINVGSGEDLTIKKLAETMRRVVGFDGAMIFDAEKPEGTPRKLLDVAKIHHLGWRHRVDLENGLRRTYAWYLDHLAKTLKRSG